jgi:leader peptidase (prepilin peptidase) / N-methyltransferase
MDSETMRLPDAFTLPGLALGVLWAGIAKPNGTSFSFRASGLAILWTVLAAAFILAIRWAYFALRRREGMGLGDAKLLAMIAAWLGPGLTLLTLFLGVVAAALAAVAWMLAHPRRATLTARLPFGAFLCAAAGYAVFEGQPILDWYLRFFR